MKGRPIQKSGRHAGKPYRRSQKEYAHDYKLSLATVKRGWAKGLPFDDPDAMGEHLGNRGRRPAESDEEFESPSVVAFVEGPEPAPAGPGAGTGDDQPEPVLLDQSFYDGRGFEAEVERLQDAARERRGAYFNAIRRRKGSLEVRNRLAEWMQIVEALRKVAKDLPGIRKANDQAVDKAEMEMVLGTLFQAFRAQATNAFVRLIEKLGLGGDADAQREAETETERLLRTLASLRLPGDTEDGAAAPPAVATEKPADV